VDTLSDGPLTVNLPCKVQVTDPNHCLFGEKIAAEAMYATPWKNDTAKFLFSILTNPHTPHTRLEASSYLRGYYIKAIRPDDPEKPVPEAYREFCQILSSNQVRVL
jgi:hypothetical protein